MEGEGRTRDKETEHQNSYWKVLDLYSHLQDFTVRDTIEVVTMETGGKAAQRKERAGYKEERGKGT